MTSLWGSKGTLLKCLIQEERWVLALEGSALGKGSGDSSLQHCKFGQMDKGMCKIGEDVLTAPWSACITSMLLWHPNTTWYSVCEGGQKKIPTMSVLPLGILPLGGHRGCLPSLPGHSTLREPKTRKVLTNPAAQWARAETKKQSTQERYTHTGPPSTPPKVHCSWQTAQNRLLVSWVSRQTESLWKLMKYNPPLSCSCNTLLRQRFRP